MNLFLTNLVKKKQYIMLFFDSVIVLCIFLFAYLVKLNISEGSGQPIISEKNLTLVIISVFSHLIFFYIFELYNIQERKPAVHILLLLTISVFTAFGMVTLLSTVFYHEQVGKIVLSIHAPLAVPITFLWRQFFFSSYLKAELQKNLLIIGENFEFKEINKLLKHYSIINYHIVDIISAYKSNEGFITKKGMKYHIDLMSYVESHNINTIVTDERLTRSPELKKQLLKLRVKGVRIYDYVKFYALLTGRIPVAYQGEDCLIFSHQGKPFNPHFFLNSKRLMDIILAVIGLVVFFPLFIIIPIAIKLTSKGPVFFKQKRLGLNEKPFTVFKFRTMIDKAEMKTGPQWVSINDPRITKVGSFLRKTHLDEIPQFINILEGTMSFVGPRPFRKYFTDLLSEKFPFYRLRLTAKPGLTGWAQVRGNNIRTEENQIENLEYDLFYIQNRSILLDFHIILKTIQTVFFGKGR